MGGKKYLIFIFLLTCAAQSVSSFLDSGLGHFVLSNVHVIGSFGKGTMTRKV